MVKLDYMKDLRVDEYTTPSPLFVAPDDSIQTVIQLFKKNGIRHLPVILNGEIVGILSDRDVRLVESCYKDLENLKVNKVMTMDPYIVEPETPLEDVVYHMSKQKIGSAIVQSEKEDYLGIFTSTDALNALLEVLRGDV